MRDMEARLTQLLQGVSSQLDGVTSSRLPQLLPLEGEASTDRVSILRRAADKSPVASAQRSPSGHGVPMKCRI